MPKDRIVNSAPVGAEKNGQANGIALPGPRGAAGNRTAGNGTYESLIALLTRTPSLLGLAHKLSLAATHDVPVLLTGETGTGKTFLARPIHQNSLRSTDPFLIVPCGAISRHLMESEFFGHVRGAFTGADREKVGKFAAAGSGTLLLDEIETLDLTQQATLLRVVETGEYEPVGSTETLKSACRLLVASNCNLEEEVRRGRFRQDLLYRLNVLAIHLPPLRDRVEDIAPLALGMVARFNSRFGKELIETSTEARAALEAYSWPGNIRELENALLKAVLASQGPILHVGDLPQAIQAAGVAGFGLNRSGTGLLQSREARERSVIRRVLAQNDDSRVRTAQDLNVSRVTLYKKMKKYGLMAEPIARNLRAGGLRHA